MPIWALIKFIVWSGTLRSFNVAFVPTAKGPEIRCADTKFLYFYKIGFVILIEACTEVEYQAYATLQGQIPLLQGPSITFRIQLL